MIIKGARNQRSGTARWERAREGGKPWMGSAKDWRKAMVSQLIKDRKRQDMRKAKG